MKRSKARRLLSVASGPILGVMLAVPVGGLLAGTAGADPTCYTGCTLSVDRHHRVVGERTRGE